MKTILITRSRVVRTWAFVSHVSGRRKTASLADERGKHVAGIDREETIGIASPTTASRRLDAPSD